MESREGALQIAGAWTRGDTFWTDGSRQDNGRVGAACVWRTPRGWTGRRFHLGTNKEVLNAEVYSICQALSIAEQRQESSRRYTLIVDSTAAIEGIRLDSIGPGQRFAVSAIEVATRLRTRDNEVTVRWVPAHYGTLGDEIADEYAKAVADSGSPDDAVRDDYRWETSLSHTARVATEALSRTATQGIADRTGDPRRNYRPPPGKGLKRRLFRRAPGSVAGRYYQLLLEHAASGPIWRTSLTRWTTTDAGGCLPYIYYPAKGGPKGLSRWQLHFSAFKPIPVPNSLRVKPGLPDLLFQYPPDKRKRGTPTQTKPDYPSPPGPSRGRPNPPLVLSPASSSWAIGDSSLGASGLPPPWALRLFIALLLSCQSGSARWCPPAGPPVGRGRGGLW